MKVALSAREKESFLLEVTVMKDQEKGQDQALGQGQALGQVQAQAAGLEVGQAVGQALVAGQDHVQSLEVGQDQGQVVDLEGQDHAQGQSQAVQQGQSLAVQQGQGQAQDQNLVAPQGQGQEALQIRTSLAEDLPQGHQQGRTNLEVKGHHRLLQALVVRLKTDHCTIVNSDRCL